MHFETHFAVQNAKNYILPCWLGKVEGRTSDKSYDIEFKAIAYSDFICDFRKLPFPSHLGKYFIKIGKNKCENTRNWEDKGHFWIGNDTHIRR